MKKNILVLIILISRGLAGFSQDLFSTENSLLYALHLQQSKQHEAAAQEYMRLYLSKPSTQNVFEPLLYNLRKSKQSTIAIDLYNKATVENKNNEKVYLEYLKSSIAENRNFIVDTGLCTPYQAAEIEIIQHYQKANYAKVKTILYNKPLLKNYDALQSITNNALATKYKKPFVAGLLSTLVPGLGKVYTRNYKDALISFIFTGLNSYQTYRYYQKKQLKSVGFWIFGSLTAGFYIGNIYGSARAAKTYNNNKNLYIKNKYNEVFDMD
jgi:hypothetical protein